MLNKPVSILVKPSVEPIHYAVEPLFPRWKEPIHNWLTLTNDQKMPWLKPTYVHNVIVLHLIPNKILNSLIYSRH